ncbi:hypothetical protein F5I97DRAFT_1847286 [Phlebopus sp. FC_14]|nr:hypothetical protein F5I97DRAFT_1847286 [Phlebopus sp. FC_14]
MHPQLSDKRIACREFMQALDACHANNWKRLTGGCNQEKLALNKCLRKEVSWITNALFTVDQDPSYCQSIERSTRNRAAAKERRLKTEQAWRELHEDD